MLSVTRVNLVMALLSAAAFHAAAAQDLSFKVTIVGWQRALFVAQDTAYRGEPTDREELYCIESWKTLPGDDDSMDHIVIDSVRLVQSGTNRGIADIGAQCVSAKGESLPMFHTHSDGNCQFSPRDLITLVARRAPFEGVQCGKRHFIWAFAWQVLAIANSVELSRLR